MDIGHDAGCPCGSGMAFEDCCGGAPRSPAGAAALASCAADGGVPSYLVTPAAGSGNRPRFHSQQAERGTLLREALWRLHEVVQDPDGDVAAAVAVVAAHHDPGEPGVIDGAMQLLYHGHGAELDGWLARALPRPGREPQMDASEVDRELREIAVEHCFARHAATKNEDASLVPLRAAVERFIAIPAEAVADLATLRRRVPESALDRRNLRFDRPGVELVGHIVMLTSRFSHLLATHYGLPLTRALLARREIEALLLSPLDPLFEIEGLHACRACAMAAPPKRDLARGATVVAIDPNLLILSWQHRLDVPGGPFRAAALLEALPLWAHFLEALRLLDSKRARRLAGDYDRAARLLAPSLKVAGDRALAAAARRLAEGRPRAS